MPLVTRFVSRRKEHLIVTSVGNSFHTYGANKLGLLSVSKIHQGNIQVLAGGKLCSDHHINCRGTLLISALHTETMCQTGIRENQEADWNVFDKISVVFLLLSGMCCLTLFQIPT